MSPHIIVFALIGIIIYCISTNSQPDSVSFNRNLLPNRNIQDDVYAYLHNHFSDADGLEFINMKITPNDGTGRGHVIAELYVFKKGKWNATQRKMQIEGNISNGEFTVINERELSNSIDIGALVPEQEIKTFIPFARDRDWQSHYTNWNEYKKDWDVKWSDEPIDRDQYVVVP